MRGRSDRFARRLASGRTVKVVFARRYGFQVSVFVGVVVAWFLSTGGGCFAGIACEIGVLVGGVVRFVVGVGRAEGVVTRKGALGVLVFGVGVIGGRTAGVAEVFAVGAGTARFDGLTARRLGARRLAGVVAVARGRRALRAGVRALGAGAVEVATAVVGKRHGLAIGATTSAATSATAAARALVLAGSAVVVIIATAGWWRTALGAIIFGARTVIGAIGRGFVARLVRVAGPGKRLGFGIPFLILFFFLV
jgi:hypothetical protein